jgi:hypothetical protein
MSASDVYGDEMPTTRFSDQDVERLLSGDRPEDVALAQLAPILKSLHGTVVTPVESHVQQFATSAAEAARAARSEDPGSAATQTRLSRSRRTLATLKRKLATGLAAVLALSGMTGIAAASDGAAPGDALYGIDRALEAIGLSDGGAAERIAEAQALFDDGLVSEAIEHAAEAVPDIDARQSETGVEALLAAAASVTGTDPEEADEVRTRVGEMLTWMADNASSADGVTGREFGQEVARRARSISGDEVEATPELQPDDPSKAANDAPHKNGASKDSGNDAPDRRGPPDDVPGGPPGGGPGPEKAPGRP